MSNIEIKEDSFTLEEAEPSSWYVLDSSSPNDYVVIESQEFSHEEESLDPSNSDCPTVNSSTNVPELVNRSNNYPSIEENLSVVNKESSEVSNRNFPSNGIGSVDNKKSTECTNSNIPKSSGRSESCKHSNQSTTRHSSNSKKSGCSDEPSSRNDRVSSQFHSHNDQKSESSRRPPHNDQRSARVSREYSHSDDRRARSCSRHSHADHRSARNSSRDPHNDHRSARSSSKYSHNDHRRSGRQLHQDNRRSGRQLQDNRRSGSSTRHSHENHKSSSSSSRHSQKASRESSDALKRHSHKEDKNCKVPEGKDSKEGSSSSYPKRNDEYRSRHSHSRDFPTRYSSRTQLYEKSSEDDKHVVKKSSNEDGVKKSVNDKYEVKNLKDRNCQSSSERKETSSDSRGSLKRRHTESDHRGGVKVRRHSDQSSSRRKSRSRSRKRERKSPSIPIEMPEPTDIKAYTNIISVTDDSFYFKKNMDSSVVAGTDKLKELHKKFQYELLERAERVKALKPKYTPPVRKTKLRKPKPPKGENESSSSSEESSSDEEDTAMEELEKKKKHPDRLQEELWYNDPGEMNDGPLCRCSAKAKRSGIRHGIYAGEERITLCEPNTNSFNTLYHYRVTMSPNTNFLSKCPTIIQHNGQNYLFEGFSMFSHSKILDLPHCKVIRFNIEYAILYYEEKFPENFTVEGLELLSNFLFTEILELVDLNWKAHNDSSGCPRFHFMPRFIHTQKDKTKQLLPMCAVLQYLLNSSELLIKEEDLEHLMSLSKHSWQDLADKVKGMIITCPGMKPSSIRVDQLDRESCDLQKKTFPEVVHFGVRPPQLSYAGNPKYQKAWRDYVKFRHLLANKPKVQYADRHKMVHKERKLQDMRMKNNLKRDVTVVISSEKFYKTGVMCDIIQHAMLLPVLVCHLRFHQSLDVLEEKIGYKFQDRYLLQLALTHPSYRENFGTNPDHARNSLTNCGIRQPEYGDRRIHYMNTRKRGINTLINIMSRFGKRTETASCINHNERLEFLGDAVVEFLSSIHLFYMFPNLEEGGLATYRAAIVQNQHLAVLSKKLQLEKFMLYAHGSDLCHDLEFRHAMANCFEALMGALFLDSGIVIADKVFSETLFPDPELLDVWVNYPPHPLQVQEPSGDRKWLASVPILEKLHEFELATGIEFTHIRLLARALTHRSLGYNNLTLGSNQRLEFLGDTVLQLVASEYLYKFFPEHHEGHLSLLRSSLVNNRTQAVVCDDLGMVDYAIYPQTKVELKAKDRADLLEAFLGALYVDKDLEWCTKFCEVCFFPRLQDFIMRQEWNDPKSKLQQCCLTLRTMDGGEPDIPVYKVIECKGPTNTRVYSVAVYFQGRRLAVGFGHSIQQAEMSSAENALKASKDLFPQLNHQKRAIQKSLKHGIPETSN